MCTTAGTHTLTLTAWPDSASGAVYADVNVNEITVVTVPFDYDGDTVPNQPRAELPLGPWLVR